jgi:hypothetical protein
MEDVGNDPDGQPCPASKDRQDEVEAVVERPLIVVNVDHCFIRCNRASAKSAGIPLGFLGRSQSHVYRFAAVLALFRYGENLFAAERASLGFAKSVGLAGNRH